MSFSIVALLVATASGCTPIAGADNLWVPNTRWVILGEMHGTNETPDAFINLVCLAAATGRPVTVALEYSVDWQKQIDAYLSSNGNDNARAALLKLPVWHSEMQDGRGSVAFLKMLDRLRRMKRDGKITGVICSDVSRVTAAGQTRDASIAQAWTAIPTAENGIILALVGNIHAMRNAMVRPERTIVTAGSLMPSSKTITVNVVGNGGKAWNCQVDGCREHDNGAPRQAATGIVYASDAKYPWSAIYELGRSTTAATPAFPSNAAPGHQTPLHIKAS